LKSHMTFINYSAFEYFSANVFKRTFISRFNRK